MATVPVTGHLDLNLNQLINVLLHPLSVDPASPVNNQIWLNTSDGRIKARIGGTTTLLASMADVNGAGITGTLWNSQSVVVAVTDDTPVPVTIAEGGFVGRPTGGNVGALSNADAKTLLGIPSGSLANEAFVTAAIAALVDTAPGALDTLNELAASIGDDADFAGTVTAALAARTQKYAADIGDGAATTITVTHSLGSEDVTVSVRPAAGGAAVLAEWEPVSTTAIEVRFNTAPTASQYRVTVIG